MSNGRIMFQTRRYQMQGRNVMANRHYAQIVFTQFGRQKYLKKCQKNYLPMCKGPGNVQQTYNVPDQAVSDAGKKRHGQPSLGPNRIYAIWASKVFPVRNCQ